MTSKEIGVINLKTEIAKELEDFWSKIFAYHMQTICAESQELRYLSSELSELMTKVEGIQNEYLRPVNVK